MDRSTPIYLVGQTYAADNYDVLRSTPTKRLVYANVTSVTASEYFEGARNGLNPEIRLVMFGPDYEGEEIAEVNGVEYAIYRTYIPRTDIIELYLSKRKGVETEQ